MTGPNRTPVDELSARRLAIAGQPSRECVEEAQHRALIRTIEHARNNSPFYRDMLAGCRTEAIRSIRDICRLPLLDAQALRSAGDGLLCVSRSRVARVVTLQTSGSTGPPKRIGFSDDDLAATLDFFRCGMRSLINGDDRVLVLLPFTLPDSVGSLLLTALGQDGVRATGYWPPQPASAVCGVLAEERVTAVVGLPQQVLAVAVSGKVRLRSVLLCSDYAAPALRRRIESLTGAETFLHYGTTESGLGGAVECGCHDGCHIRESELLIEVIDPATTLPVGDGVSGEMVITTLDRQAMPLIRYRTGDGGAVTKKRCRCGGVTSRLRAVTGKLSPVVFADGTPVELHQFDDLLFDIPGLLDYRMILGKSGDEKDLLRVDYVASGPAGTVAAEIRSRLASLPAVERNCRAGMLTIGDMTRQAAFTTQHTVKRSIMDIRPSGENDAVTSR